MSYEAFKNRVVAAVFAAILTVSPISAGCTNELDVSSGLYAKSAVVAELDMATDLVLVEDTSGFLWEFYGCEDYEAGDLVNMVMWDCGTSNTMDDMILSVCYSGKIA